MLRGLTQAECCNKHSEQVCEYPDREPLPRLICRIRCRVKQESNAMLLMVLVLVNGKLSCSVLVC